MFRAKNEKYKEVLPRPTHDVDPEIKQNDPSWSLEWAEYIYSSYIHDRCAILYSKRKQAKILRSFADGDQDPQPYKDSFLDDLQGEGPPVPPVVTETNEYAEDQNIQEGWVTMDFEHIFSPMPKIITNIIGLMESQEHDVVVQALDKLSSDLKQDLKYKQLLKKELEPFNIKFAELTGIPQQQTDNLPPMTINEIELFDQLNLFKLPYEIALQRAIDHTNQISARKEVKRAVIRDLLTLNIAAVMDTVENNPARRAEYQYIDVADLIIERPKNRDYSKSTFGGYQISMSPIELMERTGWAESDVMQLAEEFAGKSGGVWRDVEATDFSDMTIKNYNRVTIPVLYFAVRSRDLTFEELQVEIHKPKKREIESGKITEKDGKFYKTIKDKKNYHSLSTVYHGYWIIGTERIFGYGKMNDIPYDYKKKEANLPFHVVELPGKKSMVENCIPILDGIQNQFLRFQNAIIKAPPPGIAVNLSSINNLTIGNKKWKALDTLRLHSHTGDVLYELEPPTVPGQGSPFTGKPIEELKGGLGTAVTDSLNAFNLLYTQLSVASGLDSLSAVTHEVSGEQPLGTTEIQVETSNNTIKPVYLSYIYLMESVTKNVGFRAQLLVQENNSEDNYYYDILGPSLFEALVAAGMISPLFLSFYFEAAPTDALKLEVRNAAQAALAGGKNGIPMLTYSEYLFIINMMNTTSGLKWAQVYLSYKEGKTKESEAKAEKIRADMETERAIKLNKEKVAADVDKDTKLTDNKIRLAEKEELTKRETLTIIEELKHRNKMEEIKAQGEIDKQNVQNNSIK